MLLLQSCISAQERTEVGSDTRTKIVFEEDKAGLGA
jgi:hypothetical protein